MLRVEEHKKLCCVYIEDDMTIYNAAELKQQMLSVLEDERDLEINLAKVGEIDSSGVQLMMLAHNVRSEKNRKLVFTDHSVAVLDVFELMDLSGYFKDTLFIPGK